MIKRIEPVLAKKFKLPSIKRLSQKRISSLEEFKEAYPDLYEVIIGEATEQELPRPKDKKKREKYYSGKKKRHTLKTQIFIDKKGQILDVSPPFPGSWHDYKIFKKVKTEEKLPRDKPIYLDKGYQGAKKEYPSLNLFIPKKANRWHKLTEKDNLYNKALNKIKIKVEHSVLKCKRFKVLRQIYRHSLKDYHQRFQIIAGIINFQLPNKENFRPRPIFSNTFKEPIFSRV